MADQEVMRRSPGFQDRRPGYQRPGPVSPRPDHPRPPVRPRPFPHPDRPHRPFPRPVVPIRPIYPVPVHPVPIYPAPIYPGPVYPGPVYPGPYEPPYNPNPYISKSIYINRYVQFELFDLTSLMGLNYGFSGYRVRQVYVDVGSAQNAQIDLIVNGRVVSSRMTYGGNVVLYPDYQDQLNYEINILQLGISGGAYIGRVTLELERRY